MSQTFGQIAPWPFELAELIDIAHAFPGWSFELLDEDRGQGCIGLTMEIIVIGRDAHHPENKHRGVRHLFPVPAAAYNRKSWLAWIHERCRDVTNHEIGEWLRFGEDPDAERPFQPNHGEGHDPYLTYVHNTTEERRTRAGHSTPDD